MVRLIRLLFLVLILPSWGGEALRIPGRIRKATSKVVMPLQGDGHSQGDIKGLSNHEVWPMDWKKHAFRSAILPVSLPDVKRILKSGFRGVREVGENIKAFLDVVGEVLYEVWLSRDLFLDGIYHALVEYLKEVFTWDHWAEVWEREKGYLSNDMDEMGETTIQYFDAVDDPVVLFGPKWRLRSPFVTHESEPVKGPARRGIPSPPTSPPPVTPVTPSAPPPPPTPIIPSRNAQVLDATTCFTTGTSEAIPQEENDKDGTCHNDDEHEDEEEDRVTSPPPVTPVTSSAPPPPPTSPPPATLATPPPPPPPNLHPSCPNTIEAFLAADGNATGSEYGVCFGKGKKMSKAVVIWEGLRACLSTMMWMIVTGVGGFPLALLLAVILLIWRRRKNGVSSIIGLRVAEDDSDDDWDSDSSLSGCGHSTATTPTSTPPRHTAANSTLVQELINIGVPLHNDDDPATTLVPSLHPLPDCGELLHGGVIAQKGDEDEGGDEDDEANDGAGNDVATGSTAACGAGTSLTTITSTPLMTEISSPSVNPQNTSGAPPVDDDAILATTTIPSRNAQVLDATTFFTTGTSEAIPQEENDKDGICHDDEHDDEEEDRVIMGGGKPACGARARTGLDLITSANNPTDMSPTIIAVEVPGTGTGSNAADSSITLLPTGTIIPQSLDHLDNMTISLIIPSWHPLLLYHAEGVSVDEIVGQEKESHEEAGYYQAGGATDHETTTTVSTTPADTRVCTYYGEE